LTGVQDLVLGAGLRDLAVLSDLVVVCEASAFIDPKISEPREAIVG
jgi:hypothetical protein